MSPNIELYGMHLSAPVRIVSLTLEALELPYEFKEINLQKGDHLKPEYLKINPQHNIPAIKDGDFTLNESRAIAGYLVNAHGKNDSLYPKDAKVKARVDQRLYFDGGVFYKSFGDVVYPRMLESKDPPATALPKALEVLGWVNDFIKPTGYVAGTDHLTIADIAFLSTYSTIVATGAIDVTPYTAINEWFEKVKNEVPNYEKANGVGAEAFGQWYKSSLQK
jgi:glutathione S-transferase